MTVELKIKEIRKQMKISLEELSEETGIERHRLSEIEDNVDKILFIEMLVIAENLGKKITDLYSTGNLELQ
jgi:transcriptional regulator with XRE-family HTH domain|nr:MAG TPA: Helix-turn-helix XRE-family like protein [Siphoviridae sp. ctvzh6]